MIEVFHSFPQSLYANSGLESQLGQKHFPTINHHKILCSHVIRYMNHFIKYNSHKSLVFFKSLHVITSQTQHLETVFCTSLLPLFLLFLMNMMSPVSYWNYLGHFCPIKMCHTQSFIWFNANIVVFLKYEASLINNWMSIHPHHISEDVRIRNVCGRKQSW